MTQEEAVNIIKQVTEQVRLTYPEHQKVQEALRVLASYQTTDSTPPAEE